MGLEPPAGIGGSVSLQPPGPRSPASPATRTPLPSPPRSAATPGRAPRRFCHEPVHPHHRAAAGFATPLARADDRERLCRAPLRHRASLQPFEMTELRDMERAPRRSPPPPPPRQAALRSATSSPRAEPQRRPRGPAPPRSPTPRPAPAAAGSAAAALDARLAELRARAARDARRVLRHGGAGTDDDRAAAESAAQSSPRPTAPPRATSTSPRRRRLRRAEDDAARSSPTRPLRSVPPSARADDPVLAPAAC